MHARLCYCCSTGHCQVVQRHIGGALGNVLSARPCSCKVTWTCELSRMSSSVTSHWATSLQFVLPRSVHFNIILRLLPGISGSLFRVNLQEKLMWVLLSASDLYVQPIVTWFNCHHFTRKWVSIMKLQNPSFSAVYLVTYLDSGPASSHNWSVAWLMTSFCAAVSSTWQ